MHDDLYDFFYEALPGYEKVGFRETDLVCWGCFDDPDVVDYDYKTMTEWGRARMVTPGIAIGGELVTTDLVEINGMIRILLGSSYFEDWENETTCVTNDPLGNPIDKHHPWNKTTIPKPQKRDFADKYSWVVSPRIYRQAHRPLRRLRHRRRPVRAPVGDREGRASSSSGTTSRRRATRSRWCCRARRACREMELEWKVPPWSNAIERDRARAYHEAYSALVGLHNLNLAAAEVRAGRTKSWREFKVPENAVSVGFHEAARGVLSHHMVIRDGKIANYQPYPPTPWNASSARHVRHAGPVRGLGAEHADLRGERAGQLQGDRHHAGRPLVRPLPAVRRAHVLGGGKVKKVMHTPTGLC